VVFVSRKQTLRLGVGFKQGVQVYNKGKCHGFVKESSSRCTYVMLRKPAYDSRINDDNKGVLNFRDVDNSPINVSPLRPCKDMIGYVDQFRVPLKDSQVYPDLLTNKVYVPAFLQPMMAKEYKTIG